MDHPNPHQFLIAAYSVTWIIQLGYLVWLGYKWRAQKRAATGSNRTSR
jgi:threonine/homoserine/homoserine lactone efflux protein